jgi:hypothetical protein
VVALGVSPLSYLALASVLGRFSHSAVYHIQTVLVFLVPAFDFGGVFALVPFSDGFAGTAGFSSD